MRVVIQDNYDKKKMGLESARKSFAVQEAREKDLLAQKAELETSVADQQAAFAEALEQASGNIHEGLLEG